MTANLTPSQEVRRISAGSTVIITDAYGKEHEAEALSGVEVEGHSFPVVWVAAPRYDGGKPERVPWPLEAVRSAGDAG